MNNFAAVFATEAHAFAFSRFYGNRTGHMHNVEQMGRTFRVIALTPKGDFYVSNQDVLDMVAAGFDFDATDAWYYQGPQHA